MPALAAYCKAKQEAAAASLTLAYLHSSGLRSCAVCTMHVL